MSVLMSSKAAKRAARISSRLLSKRFFEKLKDLYTCKHEFLDLDARVDSQNQDLVPVLLRAIQGRVHSSREPAAPSSRLQPALQALRGGNPFTKTASLFHRSNESQLALPLMRGLESTRSRLQK